MNFHRPKLNPPNPKFKPKPNILGFKTYHYPGTRVGTARARQQPQRRAFYQPPNSRARRLLPTAIF